MKCDSQDANFKLKVPCGIWDMKGNWYPNPLLKMSANEQYERNLKQGYTVQIARMVK